MSSKRKFIYLYLSLMILSQTASAQLTLAPSFSSHMVLQRDKPLWVWGKGVPEQSVQVYFDNTHASALVTKDSNWRVQLAAPSASTQPLEMIVQMGSAKLVLNDLLVGDVWLCIGQSNMEWPMEREIHWPQEKPVSQQPLIRFLNPPPAGRGVYNVSYSDSLLNRLSPDRFYAWNGWKVSDSTTLPGMSAVAYYFARKIVQETSVPIGLIHLAIGGAPLETFIGTEDLLSSPPFKNKVQGDWRYNGALPTWIRTRGRQNLDSITPIYADQQGPDHAYKPGVAFRNGIYPLRDQSIRGVLIYQGESNAEEAERVKEYRELFKLMVTAYRRLWQEPHLPFYWVQLSSIQRPLWPMFRDEQRKLLNELSDVGMAVTSDIGHPTDVHPRDKKTVGERLARWALRELGVNRKEEVSGPLPMKAKFASGRVRIKFNYANGLTTSDGKPLSEFSLDGVDGNVPARIKGRSVILHADRKPSMVRYGWQPYSRGNLVNKAGLPASTFAMEVH